MPHHCDRKAYYPDPESAEAKREERELEVGHKLYVYECKKHKKTRQVFHLSRIDPKEYSRQINRKLAKRRSFHRNAITTWENEGGAIRD